MKIFDDNDYDYYSRVRNHCVNGKCSLCGECCGDYLPLLGNELETINQYVKKHGIKPYKNMLATAPVDITCPFLNGKKQCMIYEIQPSICRTFKCDMTISEMQKNKEEHYNNPRRRLVSLREEIFGETNPFEAYVNYVRRHLTE